jgi:hypothetical protein
MRNRFPILILLIALLATILACNLPLVGSNNETDRMVTIDSLMVTPSKSDGKNPLRLSYNYTVGTIYTQINCSIITPSGVEKEISSTVSYESDEAKTYQEVHDFSVSESGNYTAHCWDLRGPASESTSFTISTPKKATFTWEKVGSGDCVGSDFNSTEGFIPDPQLAKDGYTAVCWDGATYNNTNSSGRAFCTYKSITPDQCTGGNNTGVMYKATTR